MAMVFATLQTQAQSITKGEIFMMDESVKLDTLHTVQEVARRLGLKPSTIRKLILERRITVFRTSLRAVRISEKTVQDILARGHRPAVVAGQETR